MPTDSRPEATDFYMPVLRWKRGEQFALLNLKDSTKALVDPLLVTESIDYDPPEGATHDAMFDQQVSNIAASIARFWPNWPASLDLFRTDENALYNGSQNFVEALFGMLRSEGTHIRPALSLNSGVPYRQAVRNIHAIDHRGATLRLGAFEISTASVGYIDALLADINCAPSDVDLVIDCSTNVLPTEVIARIIDAAIDDVPHLSDWRSLTVTAGSFPESLSSYAVGTQVIPRNCFTLWQAIRARSPRRLPNLGDYAVIHPQPIEVEGFMNPSASIKYTIDMGWLLLRGQGTRTPGTGGFSQFVAHAKNLIASHYYCGPAFSWGDETINEIASRNIGPGNLETWVRIGVNHHIEFVVDRLANYAGP